MGGERLVGKMFLEVPVRQEQTLVLEGRVTTWVSDVVGFSVQIDLNLKERCFGYDL